MINVAERLKNINKQFFAGLDDKILQLKASGADVIRLDAGSPDMPPATHIIEALTRSARMRDSHGYQSHRGIKSLREAWSRMYSSLYDVELDADHEIILLMGSKEGVFHLTLALCNPGDIILIPDPGYLTYTNAVHFAEALPYHLPLLPENNYLPDLNSVPAGIANKVKLLWLNYPNNPTSATVSSDFFAEVVDFANKYGILVCQDAAYSRITFDGYRVPSIMQTPGAKDTVVEFNTLSKSHNMAGWRSGVAVGCRFALEHLFSMKTYVDSGHFLPILEASLAALTGDQSWLTERNEVYRQRRDLLIQQLDGMGLFPSIPQASIYVWCPIPEGWSSLDFCTTLLEKAHVSLTPGVVFGQNGEGFVRISITVSEKRILEAMDRMSRWLSS